MKNHILKEPKMNRSKMVEKINDYLLDSKDSLIYLIGQFMFDWHDKIGPSAKTRRSFQTIRCKGKFDGNFDYGRGILQLNISVFPNSQDDNKFDFHLGITNIDDGNWDIFKTFDKFDDANEFLEQFILFWKENVDDQYGMSLPSEDELNLILCKIGLWGAFTG